MRPECEPRKRLASEAEAEGRENKRAKQAPAADPADLKEKLSFASSKLPEIRARIEEAVARTDRVIRAMEYQAEASTEGEGGKVAGFEKLRQEEGGDKEGGHDEDKISPAIKEAEIAGHVSVRKKWAKLMTFSTPIKFSLKDAR